ncbi:uncharacterized protein LOC126676827 [Mercurialis annua]|uniref:uncharacterized protein LOC126676827 n=1 Tax=Mercurialis annua TaxID=3986 RepID=UPI00215FA4E6|nr:uncharacterized protein LOC126676827 [Mercurialis annua]XP_050227074.1 uncharacterized protein LOC126676827 [Mercurialis annua]XP_050227075.1 uncharacterized protein LOC126676827 [Mercurialis annua]
MKLSMSSTASRRVPPPCWTHQETLALIGAYRDKWFSVNRGNLRSPDWDAVAASVAESSPVPADPPKSSLQCRHKIEKLRKRYRMEKKRCLDHPGRFFSSWDLFPLLDAMAIGSSPGSKRCRVDDRTGDDRKLLKKSRGNSVIDEGFEQPDDEDELGVDQDLIFRSNKYGRADYFDGNVAATGVDLGSEFRMKNPVLDVNNSVSVAFRPKDFNSGHVVNAKLINPDVDYHHDFIKMENSQVPRVKAYSNANYRNVVEGGDGYVGFPLKTLGDVPTGFNPKIYRKTEERKSSHKLVSEVHYRTEKRGQFGENAVANHGSVSQLLPAPIFRQKNFINVDGNPKFDVNNSKASGGNGDFRKSGAENSNVKEVTDSFAELVSAIRLSTENFVKVEKMKMEMAMEMEKVRMETMLKHNQMILESQQQIVNTFAKTIMEKKEKKKKRKEMEELLPCRDKNGEIQVAATDSESIGRSGIAKEEIEGGLPES